MTGPADKLVEVLETLPPETRREITVWLLGRAGTPAGLRPFPLASTIPGEENQLVTIRLPAERHTELRSWCADHGFTMAAVVRGLIERFLEEQQRR